MTMLIAIENSAPIGTPVGEGVFRTQFPNVSFPSELSPSDVESFGYGIFEYASSPVPGRHQKAVEETPVQQSNGVWLQSWSLVSMAEAEKAEADAREAARVRTLRSSKLSQSDWTQLADAPVDSTQWGVYRQALRDITEQAGFPWSVTWPVAPNEAALSGAGDGA